MIKYNETDVIMGLQHNWNILIFNLTRNGFYCNTLKISKGLYKNLLVLPVVFEKEKEDFNFKIFENFCVILTSRQKILVYKFENNLKKSELILKNNFGDLKFSCGLITDFIIKNSELLIGVCYKERFHDACPKIKIFKLKTKEKKNLEDEELSLTLLAEKSVIHSYDFLRFQNIENDVFITGVFNQGFVLDIWRLDQNDGKMFDEEDDFDLKKLSDYKKLGRKIKGKVQSCQFVEGSLVFGKQNCCLSKLNFLMN